jgi:hypothetical protein
LGGQIAVYYNGWRYLPPDEGITLWITDESQSVQYRNGVWTDVDEFPPTVLSDLDDVSLGGSPSPQQGDVLVYNAELGEWMASGLAPTRTTVTLSGASTNVSIPAGCKWFRMVSEEITLTNGAGNLTAELYHTGNTVRQTFKTLLTAIQLSAAVSVGTGNTSFAFAGNTSSATSRGLAGTIHSPRDATKKSMGDGRGYNTTGNVFRYRDVVANSAVDDDTVRIVTDAGTITGTVHFEWFYS